MTATVSHTLSQQILYGRIRQAIVEALGAEVPIATVRAAVGQMHIELVHMEAIIAAAQEAGHQPS